MLETHKLQPYYVMVKLMDILWSLVVHLSSYIMYSENQARFSGKIECTLVKLTVVTNKGCVQVFNSCTTKRKLW